MDENTIAVALNQILIELREIKTLLAAQHRQYTIPTVPTMPQPYYQPWWGQVIADGSGTRLQNDER